MRSVFDGGAAIIVQVSVVTQKNGPKAQQDVNTMRVPRQSFRADSDCDQSERSHQQQQQSLCCCWAVIASRFKLFLSYFVHVLLGEIKHLLVEENPRDSQKFETLPMFFPKHSQKFTSNCTSNENNVKNLYIWKNLVSTDDRRVLVQEVSLDRAHGFPSSLN